MSIRLTVKALPTQACGGPADLMGRVGEVGGDARLRFCRQRRRLHDDESDDVPAVSHSRYSAASCRVAMRPKAVQVACCAASDFTAAVGRKVFGK